MGSFVSTPSSLPSKCAMSLMECSPSQYRQTMLAMRLSECASLRSSSKTIVPSPTCSARLEHASTLVSCSPPGDHAHLLPPRARGAPRAKAHRLGADPFCRLTSEWRRRWDAVQAHLPTHRLRGCAATPSLMVCPNVLH